MQKSEKTVAQDNGSQKNCGFRQLNLEPVSVIILEKSEIFRQALTGVLRAFGVRDIRFSDDPEAALELMFKRPADIVFSDWSPSLDGILFLNRIRRKSNETAQYTPVIMFSAYTDPKYIATARDSGATEYVAKPFTTQTIYSRLKAVIERQRSFVSVADFFGPDRRRQLVSVGNYDRRQMAQ